MERSSTLAYSLILRGKDLYGHGHLAEAERAFMAAENLNAADAVFLIDGTDLHVLLAALCEEQGRRIDACNWLICSHKRRPDATDILLNLGKIAGSIGYRRVHYESVKRSICLDPASVEFYRLLSEIALEDNRQNEWRFCLDRIEQLRGREAATALLRIGTNLHQKGLQQNAETAYLAAARIGSADQLFRDHGVDLHRLLAMLAQQTDRDADAYHWLLQCHNRRPSAIDILLQLATVARSLGHAVAEQAALEYCLCIMPEEAIIYGRLAELMEIQGRLAKRDSTLSRAALLAPDDPSILRRVALKLIDSGDDVAARQYLDKASSLQPDDSVTRMGFARLLSGQGKHSDAELIYRSLLGLNPTDAEAWSGLLKLYQQADRTAALLPDLMELQKREDLSVQLLRLLSGVFFSLNKNELSIKLQMRARRASEDKLKDDVRAVRVTPASEVCRHSGTEFRIAIPETPVFPDYSESTISFDLPAVYLASVEEPAIITANWTVLCNDNQLILDGLIADSRESLPFVRGFLSFLPDDRVLMEVPEQSGDRIEEAVLFGGGPNWSHGVLDWGSRLLTLDLNADLERLPVLVAHNVPKSILDLYEMMGLTTERLVFVDPARPPRVRKLWLPALTHRYQLMSPHYIEFFRKKLSSRLEGRQKSRRIYLSRKKARYRFITNEAALLDALMVFGFEVVYPEELSMAEQMELFASTEIMICPIGGGSAAAMFAPRNCTYIELCHEKCELYQYQIICSLLGQKYYQIVGQTTINRSQLKFDYDFRIPIEEVLSAVRSAIS